MTPTGAGWLVFLAALGMMCGLIAVDVKSLHTWAEAVAPAFVGTALGHLGVVIAAFVGGKLIPTK